MKYNLSTAGRYYKSGSPDHVNLLKLGFKFTKETNSDSLWRCNEPTIEINTLEDLRNLENLVNFPLIIAEDSIRIYDNYIE
jgi:hypothetical protein